jgi:hypothetical protein
LAHGGTVALAEPNVENSDCDVIATDQSQSFLSIRCSHDASPGCAKGGMKVERDQRIVFDYQNSYANKRHLARRSGKTTSWHELELCHSSLVRVRCNAVIVRAFRRAFVWRLHRWRRGKCWS